MQPFRFRQRASIIYEASQIIAASQLRAARALLGIDQGQLVERAGVSLPIIQRMEASDGVIDTLMKVIVALKATGIELIE